MATATTRNTVPPVTDRLMSALEVSRFLGVSRPTLLVLRQRGKLRAVKVGDRVLFDPLDVQAFVEGAKERAGAR